VLDNTIGSGTTAVAAINTGRNFIGIEMDKGYCDIARKRLEDTQKDMESKKKMKKVSKPVKVEFYTKDGEKVLFKGHKKVTKPVKVEFYAKRDKKK